MKFNKNGITLISLVITIVIMLILATVSINLILGNNGLFGKSKTSAEEYSKAGVKEKIEHMIAEYNIDKEDNNKELEDFLNEKVANKELKNSIKNDDGTYLLVKDGYEIVLNGESLEIISIQKVGGVIPEISKAIYQTNGSAIVSGATYDQVALTITVTNKNEAESIDEISMVDTENQAVSKSDVVIGDRNGDASFIVSSVGNYKLTVKMTKNNIQKSRDFKINMNMPVAWTETTEDDENWYNYGGATVNTPKLIGNMQPIIYTGAGADSITGNKWANVMTSDGSMFVWIPRYAYKITLGYHTYYNSPNMGGDIQIKFIDAQNNCLDGSGEKVLTDPTQITYTSGVQNEWLVHPAFTANTDNGGGFGEISGLWIGKFETTGTINKMSVKPGVTAINKVKINDMWVNAKDQTKASFGETTNLKQHMVKNSEWGVTAYLAYSQYGSNKVPVAQNNKAGFITGGSNVPDTIYITNAAQSTTANAYGVYDMVGGCYEQVASYGDNTYGTSNGSLLVANKESTAYVTVYRNIGSGLNSCQNVKGDALYETSLYTSSKIQGCWVTGSTSISFPKDTYKFFYYGGNYADARSSMFFYAYSQGESIEGFGFRMCLVTE